VKTEDSTDRLNLAMAELAPDPAILAAEIIEDLQAALDQFAQIAADLGAPERG
jgi:hypothetical protein